MKDFVIESDIKKRTEKLLKWFIPVFLISTCATLLNGKTAEMLVNSMATNPESYKSHLTNLMLLYNLLSGLDNFIVAIWLFFQARHFSFNRVVWPIFALIQPFFSILIFLFILYIERNDRSSSNESIQMME